MPPTYHAINALRPSLASSPVFRARASCLASGIKTPRHAGIITPRSQLSANDELDAYLSSRIGPVQAVLLKQTFAAPTSQVNLEKLSHLQTVHKAAEREEVKRWWISYLVSLAFGCGLALYLVNRDSRERARYWEEMRNKSSEELERMFAGN
ncbi:hypothetical protein EK21DRAFT_90465 [Setomelanomma holmii]|uniref:Uncharacterized protein n=1 Tax=Setomelanomma holmii TaxID=210430 RepID=A0A9P4H5N5_9PLEO|nr:hypothetical protein EK21DRAFT_90465 [Setomelanomma holmii]